MIFQYTRFQVEQKYSKNWSKSNIIISLLDQVPIYPTQIQLKQYINSWWFNPRHDHRSFRLTESGFSAFKRGELVQYVIDMPPTIKFTNKLLLRLDNFITGPYYLEKSKITVFDEIMAVQLILFSGDIEKYSESKNDSANYS